MDKTFIVLDEIQGQIYLVGTIFVSVSWLYQHNFKISMPPNSVNVTRKKNSDLNQQKFLKLLFISPFICFYGSLAILYNQEHYPIVVLPGKVWSSYSITLQIWSTHTEAWPENFSIRFKFQLSGFSWLVVSSPVKILIFSECSVS